MKQGISVMNTRIFSRYFRAFGDPSRLRILQLLSSGEMTAGEIVKAVGLSQPTVSRHLALLRDAGVVEDRRRGQQVIYSLNRDTVVNCCTGFCDCLAIRVKVDRKSEKKR